MCTVTYLPIKNGAIITSSRDEKYNRGTASVPSCFIKNGNKLYYPVDAKAGGTWFIVNCFGTAGILLNGADTPHRSHPPYKKSRGKVLTDIFETAAPLAALRKYDLDGIENFTIILFDGISLNKCTWNGIGLMLKRMTPDEPHIWSSVTLYSPAMIAQRKKWFEEWLLKQKQFLQDSILQFHATAGKGNNDFGLLMNREDKMMTVSITSLEIVNHSNGKLVYQDCIHRSEDILQFPLNAAMKKLPAE